MTITSEYKGSDLGQAFKDFCAREGKRIEKAIKALGGKDLEMSINFNYFSGFFTSKTGQTYYFMSSDVRYFGYDKLLYRTAKHRKDYTGGPNQYVSTGRGKLKEMRLI